MLLKDTNLGYKLSVVEPVMFPPKRLKFLQRGKASFQASIKSAQNRKDIEICSFYVWQ